MDATLFEDELEKWPLKWTQTQVGAQLNHSWLLYLQSSACGAVQLGSHATEACSSLASPELADGI